MEGDEQAPPYPRWRQVPMPSFLIRFEQWTTTFEGSVYLLSCTNDAGIGALYRASPLERIALNTTLKMGLLEFQAYCRSHLEELLTEEAL